MTVSSSVLNDRMTEAVRAASRVCRAVQADLRAAESVRKPDASPVTVADLASQALIVRALAAAFPEFPVAGEEDASTVAGDARSALRAAVVERVRGEWPDVTEDALLRTLGGADHRGGATGRFFTVDPIDGTKGFLRGDHYAVALALVEDGRVVAGVLGCPNLPAPDGSRGVLVRAVRGEGAFAAPLDGTSAAVRVRASSESDPRRLRLCESVETGHSDHAASHALALRLGVTADPVTMDSQAKYAVLATGGAELYLRTPVDTTRREWIWDHAAGAVVVEEAGGRVTDLDGAPLDFSRGLRLERNRGIVASNGVLHDAVLAALRASPAS